jgi:integrase
MNSLPETTPERERTDDPITPIAWPEFRAEFEASQSLNARGTQTKMRQVLNAVESLGITSTADLTVPFVVRFVQSRPPNESPYTTHGLLGVLRVVCNYAEQTARVRISPFRLRKLSRWVRLQPLEGKRHCTREEIRRVLELLARDVETLAGWAQWRARRLQAVVAIIAYCGLRKMEALRLRIGDVDLENRIIHIRPAGGDRLKTAASHAPVPMPRALVPLLQSWIAHRMDAPFGIPLPKTCEFLIPTANRKNCWTSGSTGNRPLDRLKAVAKRAGVDQISWQALRRSTATHLEAHGCPAPLIARVLRHSPRVDATWYRQADVPNLVAATDGFDF